MSAPMYQVLSPLFSCFGRLSPASIEAAKEWAKTHLQPGEFYICLQCVAKVTYPVLEREDEDDEDPVEACGCGCPLVKSTDPLAPEARRKCRAVGLL